MAGAREVEIKFVVADVLGLERGLKRAGFRVVTPRTYESNVLYDFADQELRRQGSLLRVRQYGERWTVTHKDKGKAGRHKTRHETETDVNDGSKMADIFHLLGLEPSFRYEKFRTEWGDGDGYVTVDETPIGNFAEIEGKPKWIDKVARRLGISKLQYITSSYASMFFAWKKMTGSKAKEMTFQAVGRKTPKKR